MKHHIENTSVKVNVSENFDCPYNQEEIQIIQNSINEKVKSFIDELVVGQELNDEKKKEVIVRAHASLIETMDKTIMPAFVDAQVKETKYYKRTSVLSALTAIGKGVLGAAYIGLSIATHDALDISLATVLSIGTVCDILEIGFAKKKGKLLPATRSAVEEAWSHGKLNFYNAVDFYLYNNLQPKISPFGEVEGVIDNREEENELRNPNSKERFDKIIEDYRAKQEQSVTVISSEEQEG